MAKYRIEALQPSSWDPGKLGRILDRGLSGKLLVIGDVGLDRYTIGTVERISPEAPVPIVLVQDEKLKLGLAANVADNIRTLGGVPWLLGIVGKDSAAKDFHGLLRAMKIDPGHLVEDSSRRTVLKDRVVSERQQLLRVDYESSHPVSREVEDKVIAQVERMVPKADAVIMEDYAKGLLTERVAQAVFAIARRAKKLVTVDPNLKTGLKLYKGASVLTPNTKEAQQLSGLRIHDETSLIQAGFAIQKGTGAEHVVITRGKDGMAIFSAGSIKVRLIPTYAREVYDVSGAGDTVIAVLTLALAGGASIEDAVVLGNLAAGVEVGKRGTATVSVPEIRGAMEFFASPAGARISPALAAGPGVPISE